MKIDALMKTAVLSIDDGKKLGYINDLLIDPQSRQLAALCVEDDGHESLIPFDAVQGLGADALTVSSASVRQGVGDANPLTALPNLKRFSRLKVVDEGGVLLGTVKAIDFDPYSGDINHLSVHKGGFLGIGGDDVTVAAKDIRGIGDEVIVVAQQPAEQQG